MKKAVISVVLILSLLLSLTQPAFADNTIKVIIDGKAVAFDQPPVSINGRTLVPLRAIFEALGATVYWSEEVKCATAVRGKTTIYVWLGKKNADINVDNSKSMPEIKNVPLDVPAQSIKGYTMVPLRFVGEALGCSVDWNGTTKTVTITSKEQAASTQNAATSSTEQNVSGDIKIFVDNTQVEFDQAPIVVNDVVFAQAGTLLRALHVYNFEFNSVSQILTAFNGLTSLKYQVDSTKARVNFKYYDLFAAPRIENSYVMIPVEFTANTYGAAVKYDTASNSVYITLEVGVSVEPKKEEFINPDNKPLDENGNEIHISDTVGKGGFYGTVIDISGTKVLVYWDSKTAVIPDNDIDYWTMLMGVKWKSNQWLESKDVEIESSGY